MKILFFASIREALSCDSEHWDSLEGIRTAEDVRLKLVERGAPWDEVLSNDNLLVARNQELVSLDCQVEATDEIAFFPPVTGG